MAGGNLARVQPRRFAIYTKGERENDDGALCVLWAVQQPNFAQHTTAMRFSSFYCPSTALFVCSGGTKRHGRGFSSLLTPLKGIDAEGLGTARF